jgi:hypothetical protein
LMSLYLVARDASVTGPSNGPNTGAVVEVAVVDVVAPHVVSATASQTRNLGPLLVRVALTFAVDEASVNVFWVERTGSTVPLPGDVALGGAGLLVAATLDLTRGATLYLVARDSVGNNGPVFAVTVSDAIAPQLSVLSAVHTRNAGFDLVDVRVMFDNDELPSTVYWVAAAPGSSLLASQVTSGSVLTSPALLENVARGHSIYLVASDGPNDSIVYEVQVDDVVAPKVTTSSASHSSNALLNRVNVLVAFAVSERGALVYFLAAASSPTPAAQTVLRAARPCTSWRATRTAT